MKKIIFIILTAIIGICLYLNIELSVLNIIVVIVNFVCLSGCAIILCLKNKE